MNWKLQQLSIFFSIPKTLESLVLANFKITHFVQDSESKNSLRKSVELSKSSNDFGKNLHRIFIFFGADFDDWFDIYDNCFLMRNPKRHEQFKS